MKKKYTTPAWTRKEGKNPKGGLNVKGRASAKAQGSNLKTTCKKRRQSTQSIFFSSYG